MVRAAQANPAAFRTIYEVYGSRVYKYVRTRVETDEDGLDVTQQVFVRALSALPAYRWTGVPLSAWLFRIARNAVIDFRRRRKFDLSMDAMPIELVSHQPGLDDIAITRDKARVLHDALLSLPADRRDLLALRYAADLKFREIAVVVGMNEDRVKKRVGRALEDLRRKIAADH